MIKMTTHRFAFATLFAFSTTFTPGVNPVLAQDSNSILLQTDIPLSTLPPQSADVLPVPQQEPIDGALQQESIDVLARGPLHEAYADVYQQDAEPSELILKAPPQPIEELPPEYQPEGDSVEWIQGYWAWDEDRQDFIWISGIWRNVPPGQRWIPGYWEEEAGGFRWTAGFWMSAELEEMTYLPQPPANIDMGPSQLAPSDQHFYTPGKLVFQSERYVWQPGYWMPRVDNWVWVPACYYWTRGGYVYRAGFWDRLFDDRGVVFAPVYFQAPIYRQVNYRFSPSYVIDTGFNLLPHLFIRNNCRQYYFGDWYGDVYAQRNFFAWSQVSAFGQFGNHYDPLFAYYNRPSVRYNNMPLINWVRGQNQFYSRNQNFRPQRIVNTTVNNITVNNINNNINNNVNNNIRGQNRQPQLAVSLEQRVKIANNTTDSGRNTNSGRNTYRKLDADTRREILKSGDPMRSLANDRRTIERMNDKGIAQGRNAEARGRDGDRPGADRGNATTETMARQTRQAKLDLPKVERRQSNQGKNIDPRFGDVSDTRRDAQGNRNAQGNRDAQGNRANTPDRNTNRGAEARDRGNPIPNRGDNNPRGEGPGRDRRVDNNGNPLPTNADEARARRETQQRERENARTNRDPREQTRNNNAPKTDVLPNNPPALPNRGRGDGANRGQGDGATGDPRINNPRNDRPVNRGQNTNQSPRQIDPRAALPNNNAGLPSNNNNNAGNRGRDPRQNFDPKTSNPPREARQQESAARIQQQREQAQQAARQREMNRGTQQQQRTQEQQQRTQEQLQRTQQQQQRNSQLDAQRAMQNQQRANQQRANEQRANEQRANQQRANQQQQIQNRIQQERVNRERNEVQKAIERQRQNPPQNRGQAGSGAGGQGNQGRIERNQNRGGKQGGGGQSKQGKKDKN